MYQHLYTGGLLFTFPPRRTETLQNMSQSQVQLSKLELFTYIYYGYFCLFVAYSLISIPSSRHATWQLSLLPRWPKIIQSSSCSIVISSAPGRMEGGISSAQHPHAPHWFQRLLLGRDVVDHAVEQPEVGINGSRKGFAPTATSTPVPPPPPSPLTTSCPHPWTSA